MTPQLKKMLDWIEQNRPELYKPIKAEIEENNLLFITLLNIGWEARDEQPLIK